MSLEKRVDLDKAQMMLLEALSYCVQGSLDDQESLQFKRDFIDTLQYTKREYPMVYRMYLNKHLRNE